jgi:ATP-dependent RNA helicase RhlE
MASAEAFKRLKPAPKVQPARQDRGHTKADRRDEGQRRQHRNARPQLQRDAGSAVYRPAAAPNRNSDERPQRTEGAQNRNPSQQRHRQRTNGHPTHRPEGGQGKSKFRGRRRFGGTRVVA